MDSIRKKLTPKKETPRKIDISAPSLYPPMVFGPGKIARYAEPEDTPAERAKFRAVTYDIPAHSERTDRPTRPLHKSKWAWNRSLNKKNFKIVIPSDPVSTSIQPGIAYSTPVQFKEEGLGTPRKAPTFEEQLARYPPSHTFDGFLIHPTPPPSGHIPFGVQQKFDREYEEDVARGVPRAPRRPVAAPPKAEPSRFVLPDLSTLPVRTEWPVVPPRLVDVLKPSQYAHFTAEQKKELLLPPPVQPDRHAVLKQKLAEAREVKKAREEEELRKSEEVREARRAERRDLKLKDKEASETRRPLVGDFVNNSASTPATPLNHQRAPSKDLISPAKAHDAVHTRSASVSQGMNGSQTTKVYNVPASTSLSKFKFGGGSSSRADAENSASTPPRPSMGIDYRTAPLPLLPHEATHARTPSRDAVYYSPADIARAGMRSLGHSARHDAEPILPRKESMDSSLSTQKPQDPIAGPSHTRSASASSTKQHAGLGLPTTSPLRVHKRNPSNPVDARSVLDYASATTSRAGPQPHGPPPVMRHRELIDTNVIKRPGRLESLPISARSKNAKEEYFTPPPRRVRTNSSGQSSSNVDAEFGVIAPSHARNFSASAATAPAKIRLGVSHGHSQSLGEKGLPAHPAVYLPEKKIRRTKLN